MLLSNGFYINVTDEYVFIKCGNGCRVIICFYVVYAFILDSNSRIAEGSKISMFKI